MERNQSYYEGALEMALIANKKAGIETQEECRFYVKRSYYHFEFPVGLDEWGDIIYRSNLTSCDYPLEKVFDWVEECQNLVIHI